MHNAGMRNISGKFVCSKGEKMNARTQESIRKNILGLKSIEELQDVQYIVKLRWHQLKQLGTLSFNAGDKVNINHSERRGGCVEHGTVMKVNRISILVKTDTGKMWQCSPNVLEKV
jgi:hypothetical protein